MWDGQRIKRMLAQSVFILSHSITMKQPQLFRSKAHYVWISYCNFLSANHSTLSLLSRRTSIKITFIFLHACFDYFSRKKYGSNISIFSFTVLQFVRSLISNKRVIITKWQKNLQICPITEYFFCHIQYYKNNKNCSD